MSVSLLLFGFALPLVQLVLLAVLWVVPLSLKLQQRLYVACEVAIVAGGARCVRRWRRGRGFAGAPSPRAVHGRPPLRRSEGSSCRQAPRPRARRRGDKASSVSGVNSRGAPGCSCRRFCEWRRRRGAPALQEGEARRARRAARAKATGASGDADSDSEHHLRLRQSIEPASSLSSRADRPYRRSARARGEGAQRRLGLRTIRVRTRRFQNGSSRAAERLVDGSLRRRLLGEGIRQERNADGATAPASSSILCFTSASDINTAPQDYRRA